LVLHEVPNGAAAENEGDNNEQRIFHERPALNPSSCELYFPAEHREVRWLRKLPRQYAIGRPNDAS
jgi:hypothetical protein